MKKIALFALAMALCCAWCPAALAQTGVVTVTGSNVTDATGMNPVATGTISFAPTDCNGHGISFKVGGTGHGQASWKPVTAPITAGAFTITLADTSMTSPLNVCYQVTAVDANGNQLLGGAYTQVQPAYNTAAPNNWCVAGACNFDNYLPPTLNLPVSLAPNLGIGTVTTVGAGSPAIATVTGSNPNYVLNLSLPSGATGATGPPATFIGAYDPAHSYNVGDHVSRTVSGNTSEYVSLVGSNTGNAPETSPSDWGLAASSGGTNAQAVQGVAITSGFSMGSNPGQAVVYGPGGYTQRPFPMVAAPQMYVFGDSTSAIKANSGGGFSTAYNTYSVIVGNMISLSPPNIDGVGGSYCADVANQTFTNLQNSSTAAPLTFITVGINDSNSGSAASANQKTYYTQCLTAPAVYAAMTYNNIVSGVNTGLTISGTHATDTTFPFVKGVTLSSAGATITFTYNVGTAITDLYVVQMAYSGDTGSSTVSVDGTVQTDTITGSSSIANAPYSGASLLHLSATKTPIASRFANIAAGSHTIVFTCVAPGTNGCTFLFAASPGVQNYLRHDLPTVVIDGVIKQNGDSNSTNSAAYDTINANVAGTLISDGFANVRFTNLRNWVNSTTDMAGTMANLGQGVTVTDAAMTAGSTYGTNDVVTSASAAFTAKMVNLVTPTMLYVAGAGTSGAELDGYICGYISATQVHLCQYGGSPLYAATTVSAATAMYGTLGSVCPGSTNAGLHPNDCGYRHKVDAEMATLQPSALIPSYFGQGIIGSGPISYTGTPGQRYEFNAGGLFSTTVRNPAFCVWDNGTATEDCIELGYVNGGYALDLNSTSDVVLSPGVGYGTAMSALTNYYDFGATGTKWTKPFLTPLQSNVTPGTSAASVYGNLNTGNNFSTTNLYSGLAWFSNGSNEWDGIEHVDLSGTFGLALSTADSGHNIYFCNGRGFPSGQPSASNCGLVYGSNGLSLTKPLAAGGTPSVTGCSNASLQGGATAGSFTTTVTGSCVVVITPGTTAAHGFACSGHDITAGTTFNETSSNTTACQITGTTTSGDTVIWTVDRSF
ncbi:MAG TPA: hypothetical protein VMU69_23755 [Bradyrhizobium sp.]|nr:hypothetical protein [Bradyrhizobium sp.]